MGPPPIVRKLLMVTAVLTTVIYLVFRVMFTLNLDGGYATFASMLLLFAEFSGGISLMLYFFQIWEIEDVPQLDPLEDVSVDVYIPTYNEDASLLRATVNAAKAMEYNHRTFLLDDGNRQEIRDLAEELGIDYIAREENRHAKAGNLNHALEITKGEFVVVLDADHIPSRNFIERMLGLFHDPKLGFVQSPHAFYNFENFQSSVNYSKGKYWEEGLLFYQQIQPGRNNWNSVIFAGSAAMFRRTALEDVGLVAVETITEDMHTGIRMSANGWRSLFVSESLIAGMAAPDVTTFHSQRLRWAEGNVSILWHDNPLLMRGLSLAQRISFWASIVHWFSGFTRLAVYLTPILLLFTGVAPFTKFTAPIVAMLIFYIVVTHTVLRIISGKHASLLNIEIFAMMTFWTNIRGCWRAIFSHKKSKFVVTSKRGRQDNASLAPLLMPQALVFAIGGLSIIWGTFRVMFDSDPDFLGLAIAGPLTVYQMWLAWAVIRRSLASENKRFSYRHRAGLPVSFRLTGPNGEEFSGAGITNDINEKGVGFIAFENYPDGSEGEFDISIGGKIVTMPGRIQHSDIDAIDPLLERPKNAITMSSYGAMFVDAPVAAIDTLMDALMNFVVPMQYDQFSKSGNKPSRILSWLADPGQWHKRKEPRLSYCLPLGIAKQSTDGDSAVEIIEAATDDVSRSGLRALLPEELDIGSAHEFRLQTPFGKASGIFEVQRIINRVIGPEIKKEHVFRFISFDGQSRSLIHDLLKASDERPMQSVLGNKGGNRNAPIYQPIAITLLCAAFLIPGSLSLFQFINRDDIFLREMVEGGLHTRTDRERFEELLRVTINEETNFAKMNMLMDVLLDEGRRDEADSLTRLMLRLEPDNLGLRFALGNLLVDVDRVDDAAEIFQSVLDGIKDRPEQARNLDRAEILLAAARNATRLIDGSEQAIAYFEELELTYDVSTDVLAEHAAVLFAQGNLEAAAKLYETSGTDITAHIRVAQIHAAQKNFKAAEQECLLALDIDPNSRDAGVLYGQVMSAQKFPEEASRIFSQLRDLYPSDIEILTSYSETLLSAGRHAEAAEQFMVLLESHPNDRRVWLGYLDSVSALDVISDEQLAPCFSIKRMLIDTDYDDPRLTAQLGNVLAKAGEVVSGIELMEHALTIDEDNRRLRLQVADTLAKMGEHQLADKHYQRLMGIIRGGTLDPAAKNNKK
jgi:cellulose synthase/poly-beta-1,6-N-acetylglucosamine synthase-like glycosyltransferase/tetratricopeptide (TPR) repeat protein